MRLDHQGPFCRDRHDRLGACEAPGPGGVGGHQPASRFRCPTRTAVRRCAATNSVEHAAGGEHCLGRKAEEITVADIIVASTNSLDATGCGGKGDCMGEESGSCMTHDLGA